LRLWLHSMLWWSLHLQLNLWQLLWLLLLLLFWFLWLGCSIIHPCSGLSKHSLLLRSSFFLCHLHPSELASFWRVLPRENISVIYSRGQGIICSVVGDKGQTRVSSLCCSYAAYTSSIYSLKPRSWNRKVKLRNSYLN
jgi:hypothetical protein